MGVDYYATAIIGVKADPSALILETRTTERGCGHDVAEELKFCPKCGKRRLIEYVEVEDLEDMEKRFAAMGLEVASATDNDSCVIGLSGMVAKTGSSRGGDDGGMCRADLPMNLHLGIARQNLREKLDPMGLWDEAKFGLWAILECSY